MSLSLPTALRRLTYSNTNSLVSNSIALESFQHSNHSNRYVKDLSLDSKRFRYLTDVLRDVALKFSDLVFAVAEVFEMSYCNVDEHDMDYVVVAERGRGEFATNFLGLVERDHNRAMDVELSYSFSELSPLIEWLETGLSLPTPIRGM